MNVLLWPSLDGYRPQPGAETPRGEDRPEMVGSDAGGILHMLGRHEG